MSCNFIMPSSAMPPNPSAHPHYQPYRSPSQMPPVLSRLQQQQLQQQPAPVQPNVATPANSSPTSPRSNSSPKLATAIVQSRQLRPHKVPLYVPAVLRPTERPTRIGAGPPTPPYSASNSFDSSEGAQVAGTDGSLTPNHDLTSSHSSGNSSTSPHASNRNHNRLGQQPRLDEIDFVRRVVTDEWNDDALDDPDAVTGTPTRDHWKPDSSAPDCDAPPCHRPFTLLTRRHHCRRCGNVFCAQHAPHQVPLDQHARFHPAGHLARACDFCWADYRAWGAARRRRCQMRARLDSGDSSATDSSGGSTPVTFNKTKNAQPTVVAASVPRDWHWSTF